MIGLGGGGALLLLSSSLTRINPACFGNQGERKSGQRLPKLRPKKAQIMQRTRGTSRGSFSDVIGSCSVAERCKRSRSLGARIRDVCRLVV